MSKQYIDLIIHDHLRYIHCIIHAIQINQSLQSAELTTGNTPLKYEVKYTLVIFVSFWIFFVKKWQSKIISKTIIPCRNYNHTTIHTCYNSNSSLTQHTLLYETLMLEQFLASNIIPINWLWLADSNLALYNQANNVPIFILMLTKISNSPKDVNTILVHTVDYDTGIHSM